MSWKQSMLQSKGWRKQSTSVLVNGYEVIDEAVLKEKLDFLRSLFFQKTVTRHMDGLEEQDLNRIVVTPQLRKFVNTYLGAIINSLEG